MKGRIIIISAPSGTGKSTIIRRLFEKEDLKLGFSVSATCRAPRPGEEHGREYYFITHEEFKERVDAGEFVEWEEVYAGTCYGTLASEVKRVTESGHNLVMDIDVKGGINVKNYYGDNALAIFIMPPSKDELERRLRNRATDDEATVCRRLDKAEFEMSFAPRYDVTVVNDNLDAAVEEVEKVIRSYLMSDARACGSVND